MLKKISVCSDSIEEKYLITYFPIIIIAFYFFLFLIPFTRSFALWSLQENRPIEILTFIFLLAGFIIGVFHTNKIKKVGAPSYITIFFTIYSLFLFIIAMEEIAWGQAFLTFNTPDFWRSINEQGETTLHNITGLQGKSEIFRLVFGIGGLIGLSLNSTPKLKRLAAPPCLFFWFFIITSHAIIDVFNDFVPINKRFDYYMQRTSELIEMMIGISAFLYLYLNYKRETQIKIPAN